VIGFGTPKPSYWSNDVHYYQRNGVADVVGNLATDTVHGTRLNQWAQEPSGPGKLDRQAVHLHMQDLADGGHMSYLLDPPNNPLAQEKVPAGLQYSDDLKLIAAYRNPALGTPPPLDEGRRELESSLLSPKVQKDLDAAYPEWRTWLGVKTDEQLRNLPPGIRNEAGNSVDAVFQTYLDSEKFKTASPEQKKQMLREDEKRLVDVVSRIAHPLGNEILRQKILDWWKAHVHLPW